MAPPEEAPWATSPADRALEEVPRVAPPRAPSELPTFDSLPGGPLAYWRLRPNLFVPREFTANTTLQEFSNEQFELGVRFSTTTLKYSVSRLAVRSDKEITPKDLHAYSLPRLISSATGEGLMTVYAGNSGPQFGSFEPLFEALLEHEGLLTQIALGMDDEAAPNMRAYYLVGLVYSFALATGRNPNKSVVQALGTAQRTATLWIAKARSLGLLDTPKGAA